ncbi:MAG: co-chaperone GroES family protein [Bacteroidales bacterium]|nr:co-chaperone GroES family protein [Bacteroidales bacterium]NCU36585.1 co-chaperone GroES [Candidatus Falkowbacteria bacterium]MDD2632542.1 co-chaperone GroES family protein [Bacteroidales bacterium]MDD3130613.1 co-chaperone GroES family protein [Bacteroidales bacterium]MDD3526995.1 co-chaperone GroES family protein [Bacteroidales bacterium]
MTKSADISRLIVVGDRVLIKPKTQTNKSRGGLYLPAGYTEKEEVQSGYVIRTGPGYPIPISADDNDEPWKHSGEKTRYIPLQAKEGDLAIFMQKAAVEIVYHGEKYFIVPQHSILLLERDEELFD